MVVQAAGFYQSGNECGGATQPVYIQAEPNPRGDIQVGFFESSAEAIGKQSKAAGWLAALVSTELLEEDLSRHRISFSRSDRVDGASAGGLMTSGLVALLRGDSFPGDASMTGTINPDGTIGPVGGIAHKIQGAAETGITRFAVPLGQREDTNICSGEVEDVVEIGRALGVEVAEVGTIREAYTFLTGITLPSVTTQPLSLEISADLRSEFRALYQAWSGRYQTARSIVAGAQSADFPDELRSIWAHGEAFLATGERELRSGHEPAAFNRMWMAVLNAEFTARGVTAMQALRTSGIPGVHDVARQEIAGTEQRFAAALADLRPITVGSVADAGAVATIGSQLATALAFLEQAKREFQQSQALNRRKGSPDPAEVVLLSFEALSHTTLAQLLLDAAILHKGWIGRSDRPWTRVPEPILSARALYLSAARSNLRYVDVLYTAAVAKERGRDVDSVADWIRRKDPAYLAAVGALPQQFGFFELFDDEYTAALAQLGALMGSVANASLLVAQHYSIGVTIDELGRVIDYHRKTAFDEMMALAERTAVQAAGEANSATGGDGAPMLLVALDAARRNRDESITAQDKFTALSLFWTTTLNARLMTRLAGAR